MFKIMFKKIFILLIINVFSGFVLRGQSPDVRILASAGGYVAQGDIEVSYTLGEPFIASGSTTDNTYRITSGFQQPDKGKIVKGVIKDACSGLPLSNATVKIENPTDSTLSDAGGNFSFEIFSKKDIFQYSFQKSGNKTISMQPYRDSILKVNLGRTVDSNINILVCQNQVPYRYKTGLLSRTTDTIIKVSLPSTTTPNSERCDSLFHVQFKVDGVRHDIIDTVICSHNDFILPRSRRVVDLNLNTVDDSPLLHQSGCDSVTTTYRFSFYRSPIKIDKQEACYGETLRYKNKTFTSLNPTANDTVRGAAKYGCDSITQISVTFERVRAINDQFSFPLDNALDTTISVLSNDLIYGNYVVEIKDTLKVGTAKLVNNNQIRLKIPVNLLSETSFSYQLCADICPTQCSQGIVSLKFTRDPKTITGSKGESTIITPNGDGLNDALKFDGLEHFPNNSLTVVNRWGQQVYFARPYKNDWGGTNQQGQELPDGTYFYSMNLDVSVGKVQWGSITIVRK